MIKFFELILEIIGFIRITLSPLLLGALVGVIIYYNMTTTLGLIIGIGCCVLGLILGVIWAIRKWKKEGTMQFLSKISATPDLDTINDDEATKKP